MRHKHRVRQAIINYLLSFIFMLSIIVIVAGGVSKWTFASKRAVLHAADKTHYYYNLKNEIEQKAIDIGKPFGVDKECINGVFINDEVKEDVIKTLDERLNNEKEIIDIADIDRRIKTNVEKRDGKLNQDQINSLNVYVKKIQEMYMEKIHFPTEKWMVTIINESTALAWYAIPLAIVIGFTSAFYLIVSRHYAYHGLRFVIYGLLGAGILLTVGFAAMVSNGSIYSFNLTNSFLKDYYGYYIGHFMLMGVIFGVSLIVLSLIGVFLVYRQKYAVRR